MNSSGWIATIVIIILVLVGAWWFTQQPAADTNININATTTPNGAATTPDGTATTTGTGTGAVVGGSVSVGTPKTVTVTYSASGFSPRTVTINRGDTVRFTNSGSGSMWVASDEHPAHTNYDGTTRAQHCTNGPSTTSFDQCQNGGTYSFTFNKTGSFDYHNHSAAQFGGTITVQ